MIILDSLIIGATVVLIAELNNKLTEHLKKIKH